MMKCLQTTTNVPLYLSKSSNSPNGQDVKIAAHFMKFLKPFQVEGIRFLFHRYQKSRGAVLNDESGLGRTVQTTVLVSVLPVRTLIVCRETRLQHWRTHFNSWSTHNASFLEDDTGDRFIIASIESYGTLLERTWETVVIDDLDPAKTTDQLSGLKCKFIIWLAKLNLLADPVSFFKILNLMYPGSMGVQKQFLQKFSSKDVNLAEGWKRRRDLCNVCGHLFMRRLKKNIQYQLPFAYKVDFQKYDANTICGNKMMDKQSIKNISESFQDPGLNFGFPECLVNQDHSNDDKCLAKITEKKADVNTEELTLVNIISIDDNYYFGENMKTVPEKIIENDMVTCIAHTPCSNLLEVILNDEKTRKRKISETNMNSATIPTKRDNIF